MKKMLTLLAVVFTLAAARADFVIEQQIESPQLSGTTIMKMKDDQIRIDIPTGPMGAMSTIMNLSSGDVLSLMHTQKMGMKIPGDQMKKNLEMMKKQQGENAAETAKPQPTGKSEKIGGYETEIYTLSTPHSTSTLWVAKDYPNFPAIKVMFEKLSKSTAGAIAKGVSPDYSQLPGMVVKSVTEAGGQKITTTLISVKEEPVDAALFDAPKEYKISNMPAMPGAGGE